jgi:anti-sigma regulatory factor (Ser/Thr protein kinase)
VGDAELVVSELLTNAIQAGCSTAVVNVSLHPSHVLLSVQDDAPGQPQSRLPLPEDEHGRGLHVVGQLVRRWGVRRIEGGKEVWAELAYPPGVRLSDHLRIVR